MTRPTKTSEVAVCLACSYFYPLYGGASIRFKRYAPGLARRGVQMRVFTPMVTAEAIARQGLISDIGREWVNGGPSQRESRTLSHVVDGLPIQYVDIGNGWAHQRRFLSRLVRYCKERPGDIDVIQFMNLDRWGIPSISRLRHLGIGSVFSCTVVGNFSPNRWRRAAQRLDRRIPFELIDRVIVSSDAMRRYVEELGVSTPIEVISNGVDLDRFQPAASDEDKARLRMKLGLDPDWEVVLSVAPIVPRKGADVLVEAFVRTHQERPKMRLVLVGPGARPLDGTEDRYLARIRRVIQEAGAQERVIFTGTVGNVEEYYQAADVYVFPSRREGFGNAVLEAMACGLPVILMPFIGLPLEFGTPGEQYVLSDWAAETLASDIRRLLEDSALRLAMGRRGRRWVEEAHGIDRSLDRYAQVYREVAEKYAGARARVRGA